MDREPWRAFQWLPSWEMECLGNYPEEQKKKKKNKAMQPSACVEPTNSEFAGGKIKKCGLGCGELEPEAAGEVAFTGGREHHST